MSKPEKLSLLIATGQGSLRSGIYELADRVDEVKETYDQADEISLELFGPDMIAGKSLSEHAKHTPQEELSTNTVIAQPLIVATSIGLIKYLKKQQDFTTAYGHSLGELSALFAAGSLSERDALRLSMLRGIYSSQASHQRPGGMAALLNIPHEIKERLNFGEGGEDDEVVIATDNNPDEFTVSGPKDKVDALVANIKNDYQKVKGLSKEERRLLPNAVRLKIEGGFHSWMMRPAQKDFRQDLDSTEILVPTDMNYFSNHSHTYEGSPDIIRQHLEAQLVNPVKFWRDIGQLVADGHVQLVESGAGSILTKGLKAQKLKGRLPDNIELIAAEEELIPIAA